MGIVMRALAVLALWLVMSRGAKAQPAETWTWAGGAKGDVGKLANGVMMAEDEIEPSWWTSSRWGRNYLWLYQGRICRGFWDQDKGFYFPFRGAKAWEERKTPVPPLELPVGWSANPDAIAGHVGEFFGVESKKLSRVDRYELGGVAVDRAAAARALKLADDSTCWHITVIDADRARRERVVADLRTAPALAEIATKTRVQAYDPGDKVAQVMLGPFQLDRDGRYQEGRFAIYVQPPEGPDGRAPVYPIYRYNGAEDLAAALRTIDPTYDPGKNKTPDALGSMPVIGWVLLAAVGALAVGLLRRREE